MRLLTAISWPFQRWEDDMPELAWGKNYDRTKYGLFKVKFKPYQSLCWRIIAKQLEEWDHVTVCPWTEDMNGRCPNWEEMETVKRAFFYPEETAMQLHVPVAEHLNTHPYLLHLWRPRLVEIPRPGKELV